MPLRVERRATASLAPSMLRQLIALCDAAYDEDTGSYLRDIGPGEHLLGWKGDALVSHLMWVRRQLQVDGGVSLDTAYIELVATHPNWQNQGHASRLLAELPPLLMAFDIAALSPATDNLYLRLGWQYWEGPLSTRRAGQVTPDPEERIMTLTLPRTPPGLDRSAPLSIEWRPGEVW